MGGGGGERGGGGGGERERQDEGVKAYKHIDKETDRHADRQ